MSAINTVVNGKNSEISVRRGALLVAEVVKF